MHNYARKWGLDGLLGPFAVYGKVGLLVSEHRNHVSAQVGQNILRT
jgi:hypothetical protein